MTKQIILFIFLFIPTCWLLKTMNTHMPDLEYLNYTACILLLFFLYVSFTIKTEIITIKKTQIVSKKKKSTKQIHTSNGQVFETWRGFSPTFVHGAMATPHHPINILPRITDTEFKKIKPGQKYHVKTFQLIGKQRFIWSIEPVKTTEKKTR